MIQLNTKALNRQSLNEAIRELDGDITLENVLGQRFIAAGMSGKTLEIHGTPGNALGAYLNGAVINVHGNAQDAVGDTMNSGRINVFGNIGDAPGYAMRGGRIYVKGNAGYRAGIHMKAYKEHLPVLMIGGKAGSFLGEYQAGGVIIVLGLSDDEKDIVANFPCTGMHGGKMYLRSRCEGIHFPHQVTAHPAQPEDLDEIREYIEEFADIFGYNAEKIISGDFTVIVPDSKNPYQQMYVAN
ncbi:MAG: glutamate synthase [Ruminococcus sp.]|nr:glutamate synthase [Ruminococcus sp.]MBQ6336841.1 glutamate synthase [Ruminococcus sp.]